MSTRKKTHFYTIYCLYIAFTIYCLYIALTHCLKKRLYSHYRADGTVNISTTVPDTITSWIASAFAVNSVSGLGVSPTTAKVCYPLPLFRKLRH